MPDFVSYLRVSTSRQGDSGLGLEAQREAVARYLGGVGGTLSAEFQEVETGKGANALAKRPRLRAALEQARKQRATLIVAKLDRLTRSARLLLELVEASGGAGLVFCDLPEVPPGPVGKFMLTQLAAVAEFEAGMISQRTKAALAAAKARGTKLGANGQALADRAKADAYSWSRSLSNLVGEAEAQGITTPTALAGFLNESGALTREGGRWYPATAARLIKRLEPAGTALC